MKKIELQFQKPQGSVEPVADVATAAPAPDSGDGDGAPVAKRKTFRLRWGIIGGACVIAVFYLTIGFIAAWMILNQIAAQTSHTASPFGTWWQVAVFVADIAFALGAIGAYVMVVLNGVKRRREHVTQ